MVAGKCKVRASTCLLGIDCQLWIDSFSFRSELLADVRGCLGARRVWTRRALADRSGYHNAFDLERATGMPSRARPTLRKDSHAIELGTHEYYRWRPN